VVLLFGLGYVVDRTPDFDPLFHFESIRTVPAPAFVLGAAVVLALLAIPSLAARAAARLAPIASAVPRRARLPLLVAGAVALFLLLPSRDLKGDAAAALLRAISGKVYPSNALFDFTLKGLWLATGLDPLAAVRLLAAASGAVFAFAAAGLAREFRPDPAGRATFTGLFIACGTSLLFFGDIEVYAPMAAASAVYLWFAVRRVTGSGGPLGAPLALGVAFAFHGSAALLLPSLLFAAPGARPRVAGAAGRVALFLLPPAATFAALFFGVWGGSLPPAGPERTGSFLGAMGASPLLPALRTPQNLTCRYAILDLEHLLGVVNVLVAAAPAGLALFLAARRRGTDPVLRPVLAAAIPLALFPLLLNVSFPLRYDWALFAAAGLPLTLAGTLAFFGREREAPGLGFAVVLFSVLCLVPPVLARHGGDRQARRTGEIMAALLGSSGQPELAARYEAAAKAHDPRGTQVLFREANRAVGAGQMQDAERLYRLVLAREPGHPLALANLGLTLASADRSGEARKLLLEAVRVDPVNMEPRWVLANLMLGDRPADEVIDFLERSVRAASAHPRVPDALRLLADLREARGDKREAAAARRMAERLGRVFGR
jgi:tetratricopeptide (TPR) repeat protein